MAPPPPNFVKMKKPGSLLVLPALFSCLIATAQQKMDFQLRSYLAKPHAENAVVDLFIHGEREAVTAAVQEVGGHVKLTLPSLVSARVPVARVSELAGNSAVRSFEFSLEPGQMMNDSMRVKNRVDLVHQGAAPLGQGYDGTGVILGFIDSGLDILHPDFRDADGNTRVHRYWDQVPPPNSASPAPFGYGTEWTREQLDAGGPIPVEPPSLNGHGTTVIGTGAGNGLANGRHKGVAPEADIVVVATNFGLPNWKATVADGVAYIFDVAAAAGKPAVINASLGTYLGSHDGKDAAALFIEELLEEQGGRMMVAAAGNSNGLAPYHMQHTVDADTAFTWFRYNPNSGLGFGAVFFEVWADVEDFNDVHFAIGADKQSPVYGFRGNTPFRTIDELLGETVVDTLRSVSGNRIGVVEYYAEQRGGQYLMQVLMQQPDSSTFLFRFMTTGSGKFDVWSTAQYGLSNMVEAPPPPGSVPHAEHYVSPDRNKHMVDSWTCLSNVLTVANYCNEVAYTDYAGNPQTVPGVEQDIAPNSSRGPTRDERMKPDIAATGDITFTAGPLETIQWIIENQNGWKIDPGGMHLRNGGTSMASPVVAGAVALFLEKCPDATTAEIMEAVRSNARADAFTGSVPNNRWGHGKLDAFNTVLNKAELITESTSFCDGAGVEVSAPEQFISVQWSNGAAGSPLQVQEGGDLSAILQSATGCEAYSDTLTFTVLPTPVEPTIDMDGSTLSSSPAPGYQWYLEGEPIPGATDQTWTALEPGSYQVEAINTNGCTAFSSAVVVLTVGVEMGDDAVFGIWPSPAQDELRLQVPGTFVGPLQFTLISSEGRIVRQGSILPGTPQHRLPLNGLAAGTYTIQVQAGEEQWSRRFVKLP